MMAKNEMGSTYIQMELKRPMQNIEPPYGQCDRCQYVSIDIVNTRICPVCRCKHQGGYKHWPDPELEELGYDAIAMCNEQRVELAAVVAAMYFESSVFHLMYWGCGWLDSELSWIGLDFNETAKKQKQIWSFLDSIRTRQATNKALKRIFGLTDQEMLIRVLGENEAESFLKDYRELAEYRNGVIHKGRRSIIRIDGIPVRSDRNSGAILDWCLEFIPACRSLFAKLHNEFLHKPMWERKRNS
jgi:hypothetical protein